MSRRKLSVLATDPISVHELLESADPEKSVEVLSLSSAQVSEAIIRHGGSINKGLAGAFVSTFPAPLQAVRAAQEIAGLRWNVGRVEVRYCVSIATGQVAEAEVGPPLHRLQVVLGKASNQANLLLNDASENATGIAMCEETRRAIETLE